MAPIVSLFAWLVGVAAGTLDWAVYYTVIRMGAYVSDLTAIGVTWRILRDIGNIALIFGFLAIGISTILNTERVGYGRKMLPMLLVAAIFLNFSLFFAEAVIDVGNLFATQFYTQINGGVSPTADTLKSSMTGNEGISNKLMGQLGLQSIYSSGITNTAVFTKGSPWYIGLMAILLFIVVAFVMFSLTFILIARFVILVFLIILSPIGFVGLAIPQLAGRAKQWWGTLFAQTITAPVLLLLLYIALAVITDAQFLGGIGGNSAGAATGWIDNGNLPGFFSYLLSFLIAMGLMLAVTISAKSLSAFGASKATALAGKLTFGATAWGMRSTVGAGSQAASQALRRTRFGATKYGRILSTTLDKGAKASFDVRGASSGGGLKSIGVEAGDAAKGGYREKQEKTIKDHKEYAKSLADAIGDRNKTKAEVEAQAQAQANHTAAEAERDRATQQRAAHQAEISRLEEKERRNPGSVVQSEIDTARLNLVGSEARFAEAATQLGNAATALTNATGATTKNISAEKKASQERYAGSIDRSVPAWVMYGSGGSKAAKGIRAEAGKSADQKFLENLRKAVEDSTKPPAPANPPVGAPVGGKAAAPTGPTPGGHP
jgi:hypothetical protein